MKPLIHTSFFLLLSSIFCFSFAAEKYAAIFNFGDSLADVGNLCVDGIPSYLATARWPYGMTYFEYPTGRCSDGRVVIDFIAQAFGLPLLPPSKAKNATFRRGANFAITGATALDMSFFEARGLSKTVWNSGSLHTQLQWFEEMKPSICSSPQECKGLFGRSLFIVGEFGGNDYNSPLFAGRDMMEAHTMIPHVVESISSAVEKLIEQGALDLVVPGVLPNGCLPVYLTFFKSKEDGYGPQSGCLRKFNTLAWVHNSMLQRAVSRLREKYPAARIVYADYYTPVVQFMLHPQNFGFHRQLPKACCGAAGQDIYNFNLTAKCGDPGAEACEQPAKHWSWDGIHLTEAAYGFIAKGWLNGPFADPPIMTLQHP
ncbi:GDSL esterase/lipase At5g45910-like [Typha latifolia]|uniref:GDSL esterase/lipase At5g45910-like n=1 Tax=Typha latifolia TaxID=4733 RepID=UPI003C2D9B5E